MNPNIVPFRDLKELFGGSTVADVTARLSQNQISYGIGNRGKPFTTLDAIHKYMGLTENSKTKPAQSATIEIK